MTFIRLSVLLFYKRIFSTAAFQRQANIMMGFVVAWFIAFFFSTLFQAAPVSQDWDPVGTPTINSIALFWALGGTDLLLDLAILCLPMFVVHQLQLPLAKKLKISCIFGLGFL